MSTSTLFLYVELVSLRSFLTRLICFISTILNTNSHWHNAALNVKPESSIIKLTLLTLTATNKQQTNKQYVMLLCCMCRQEDLFKVLKAYTIHNPTDGYCQAQAPVAAVLLMHMPAEQAFWCLVSICEKYLPGYYSEGLVSVHVILIVT